MIVCRLADILEERSMSRRELARRSRLNINTVCKWARGDIAVIDLAKLAQVCAALQVQPGELLVWEKRGKNEEMLREFRGNPEGKRGRATR
jgi:DNA-binding Xre family transcriptional regulator